MHSYSKHIFDFYGGLTLLGGGICGLLIVNLLYVLFSFLNLENYYLQNLFHIFSIIAVWTSSIVFFDYFMCYQKTRQHLKFNLKMSHFSTFLTATLLMFGMIPIANFLSDLIPKTGKILGPWNENIEQLMNQVLATPFVIFVSAVILAPIFEEIVFRGIVLKGLLNKGFSSTVSIAISSFLFGLVHGNPWQFVGATLLGIVLGLVYYRTQTLILPILLHAINNGLSLFLFYSTGEKTLDRAMGISYPYLVVGGGILYTIAYFYFTKKCNNPKYSCDKDV